MNATTFIHAREENRIEALRDPDSIRIGKDGAEFYIFMDKEQAKLFHGALHELFGDDLSPTGKEAQQPEK